MVLQLLFCAIVRQHVRGRKRDIFALQFQWRYSPLQWEAYIRRNGWRQKQGVSAAIMKAESKSKVRGKWVKPRNVKVQHL